ncbi:MAG: cell division FtsA domain-containing protein [Clostridia bacterium]
MNTINDINDNELIFALDIGTRSVIGIVGHRVDNVFKVLAMEKQEYTTRVVQDGQIEHIAETAITAGIVKIRLEETLGRKLTNVYIAAAGRSLMTEQVVTEMAVDKEVISEEFVRRLEFSAVEQAIEKISSENDRSFYYVGHTVQKYVLDEYLLANLVDHKGEIARAFIIATFLPQEVVESLCATMKRIGLKISGLTLEPIAAMNVVIPSEIRKLNLALCDIGAGTSDIAICKGGSVIGYTMATIAGDEITETIMEACLVDFEEGERIKFELSSNENSPTVTYHNVLGKEEVVPRETLLITLNNTIKCLADTISERILEMNGEAPAAVFLSGGGSYTPNLSTFISEKLDLDANKVAIGSNVYMKKLVESEIDIFAPDFATPVGIAVTAMQQASSNTFNVKLNGQDVHLFNLVDTSVYAILQVSGHKYTDLVGKIGKNLRFMFDGEEKIIRGDVANPATVSINGKDAALGDTVKPGDFVSFTPALSGNNARCYVSNLVDENTCYRVTVNGKIVRAGKVITINGTAVDPETEIFESDELLSYNITTLADLRGILVDFPDDYELCVNNTFRDDNYVLCDGDDIQIVARSRRAETKAKTTRGVTISNTTSTTITKMQTPTREKDETPVVSEPVVEPIVEPIAEPTPVVEPVIEPIIEPVVQPVAEPEPIAEPMVNTSVFDPIPDTIEKTDPLIPANSIKVIVNNKNILLPPKDDGTKYLFLDMIALSDIDPNNPQGNIMLRLNGLEPSYLQEIFDGDKIDVYWDNK